MPAAMRYAYRRYDYLSLACRLTCIVPHLMYGSSLNQQGLSTFQLANALQLQ